MKKLKILALAALCALMCGCSAMTAEDFYSLPQLSSTYIALQSEINALMSGGAEYASPSSGQNRQAVQLEDLNGDGKTEAIVFTSVRGDAKPLKIHIFEDGGDKFTEVAKIEGEGTGIESVSYLDMDMDGSKEIAVGWRIASGMNILSVYSMKDYSEHNIFSTDYTKYSAYDLDGDGADEIAVLHAGAPDGGGSAELFRVSGGAVRAESCALSDEIRTIERVRTTVLEDNAPAIIVESRTDGGGLVTDILASGESGLRNLAIDALNRESSTLRPLQIWSRDLDGDGVIEVPQLEALPYQSEAASIYYLTRWYHYDASGYRTCVASTYMNNDDSWYLTIPEAWCNIITVRDQAVTSGERAVILSVVGEDGESTDFLVIYTVTGDNREERASAGRRFILRHEEDRVYAAAILPAAENGLPIRIDRDTVRESFNILYSEWITGEG